MGATAADVVVNFLAERGVRRFYTVPGESFLEIIDAVDRHPDLRLISCRHESGAAFMAEADGKITGVPAVAMGTRAVGAANLSIGVHTARQDSTPMLVLLGQVATPHLGKEAFQEVDLPTFYSEITTHAETVQHAARAGQAVARAYRNATTGRPGPAMLAFAADALPGECAPVAWDGRVDAPVRPDDATLDTIDALLRGARRPVVIAGRGAQVDPAPVVALAERYGLGVYTAFRRQDAFPNSHPQYLGHLTLGTAPDLLEPLRDADLVLVLGSRLSESTTQTYTMPPATATVVQVDPDPAVLGATVPVRHAVAAPVGPFAEALLARGGEPMRRDWASAHQAFLDMSDPEAAAYDGSGVHPARVIAAMRRHLPDDAILTNDAGNFAIFGHRYWRFEHPHSQAAPTSGAMGYAVPAAVGAGLAAPSRRVVALAGDGGFLMTGQELETAVRENVPVLVIVFQNGLYGTIAMHQARENGRPAAVDIGDVDIAAYARALGADAIEVTDPTSLDAAFETAAAFDRPRVVVVRTDRDILSPTATLSGLLDRDR